jgi:hypothetical protein
MTRNPFLTAGIAGFTLAALAFAALALTLGAPTAEGAGYVIGRLIFTVTPAVLVTGWLARRSAVAWGPVKIAVVVLLLFAIVTIVTGLGAIGRG